MSTASDNLRLLSENWFLQEPAFFALYCQQQLTETVRMDCAVRCGQGRIEYNPLILQHKTYAELEQLMRIELIRLFLKHPYERLPEGCCHEAISIGSDITIADGYCLLHHEKLPLRDPAYYHLPLGQYYEWYAKAIQQQQEGERQPRSGREQQPEDGNSNSSNHEPLSQSQSADTHRSQLWREDSVQRQRINELIERTNDWGTIPADVVERIKASTQSRTNQRLVWQGFSSAVLSCQRQPSRMRPNRRTGFTHLGYTRQFKTHLLAAIDTSGSVTDQMLSHFYGSINRLFAYGNTQIDCCQFDAQLGPIVPMQQVIQEVTVKGRGGTSFQPIFDYIDQRPHAYDGLIILTDGQAPPPVGKPRIPLLWVCHDLQAYQAHHAWMSQLGRCCHLV